MTEKEQLLRAVAAAPADLTRRLAYADWLGENETGDLAAATAEFITVSCRTARDTAVMPRAAYAWLRGNWWRLVPSVCPVQRETGFAATGDTHPTPDMVLKGIPIHHVSGRTVWARVRLVGGRTWTDPAPPARVYSCSCYFEFWKGFLLNFHAWSDFTRGRLEPALAADQPLWKIQKDARSEKNKALHEVLFDG